MVREAAASVSFADTLCLTRAELLRTGGKLKSTPPGRLISLRSDVESIEPADDDDDEVEEDEEDFDDRIVWTLCS